MSPEEYKVFRAKMEQEANKDLNRRTLDELLADIHDEALKGQPPNEALVHIMKRYSAIIIQASRKADEGAQTLATLTKWLIALTIVLSIMTAVLVCYATKPPS